MFTLLTDRSKYFRIRRGQSAREVESVLSIPVVGGCFAGKIIKLPENTLKVYRAAAGDTYRSIAEKFNADKEELKKLNGNRAVFPTAKIFIPR